jgi:hypothetical protein
LAGRVRDGLRRGKGVKSLQLFTATVGQTTVPITFTVDHARREVHAVASGRVTFDEIEGHVLKQRDARVVSYRELFDGRLGEVEFAAADTPRIVELMRKLLKEGPIGAKAVIAPDGYVFGVSRMIEMLAEEFCEIKIFRDEDAARNWLAAK